MSAIGRRILIVDDEVHIRRFLRISLQSHGYEVVEAETGREALEAIARKGPDLVILDLGLPDLDGRDVIAEVRKSSQVPVIVLSVRAGEDEKVAALDAGANDYIVKPFGIDELLARVRVGLRDTAVGQASRVDVFSIGTLTIDLVRHRVMLDDQPVRLTRKEFEILALLGRHAGRIVTHAQILREVWGKAHERDTHYLRVYIGHLRQKLGDDPQAPRFIENEPGVGYRLIPAACE